jgi:hypothetical protein
MENSLLKDKVRAMEEKINNYENFWIDKTILNKLESKLRDYENKLEFEQVQKNKLQVNNYKHFIFNKCCFNEFLCSSYYTEPNRKIESSV